MTEKRFSYYRNSQMIVDNLTEFTYTGNRKICNLLNELAEENQNLRKCINAIYIISSRESVE